MTERIISAAIHWQGVICSLPSPARHHSLFHALHSAGAEGPIVCEQGFLTSTGRFVNRVEAKHIAEAVGQIRTNAKPHPRELFSEDLW